MANHEQTVSKAAYEYVEIHEMLPRRHLRCVWSVNYTKPSPGSAIVIQEGPRIPEDSAKEDQWGICFSTHMPRSGTSDLAMLRFFIERGESLTTHSIFKVELRESTLNNLLWSHYEYAIKLDVLMTPTITLAKLDAGTRLSVIWEVEEFDPELHKQLKYVNKPTRGLNFRRKMTSDSEYVVRTTGKDLPCSIEALKSSPVFEKMMESDMKEKQSKVIDLTDVLDTETAEDLVSFLSTGMVPNIDSTCLDLLKVACLYDMEELKVLCQIELVKSLNVDNVAQLLQLAHQHGAKWLRKHIVLFIKGNIHEVRLTEGWKSVEELMRVVVEECLM